MTTAITKVCKKCGSDDVKHDAWAEWDVENQLWELGATFDHAFCEQCDGETTIIDKEIELGIAESVDPSVYDTHKCCHCGLQLTPSDGINRRGADEYSCRSCSDI